MDPKHCLIRRSFSEYRCKLGIAWGVNWNHAYNLFKICIFKNDSNIRSSFTTWIRILGSGSKTLNSYQCWIQPIRIQWAQMLRIHWIRIQRIFNPKFTSTSEQLLGIPVEEVDQGIWRVHEGIGHTLNSEHVLKLNTKKWIFV